MLDSLDFDIDSTIYSIWIYLCMYRRDTYIKSNMILRYKEHGKENN
jgi:hypothetical protein